MGEKFSETYRIPCYFTDCNLKIRPVSFMDMCQEIAGRAVIEMNCGDDVLLRENNAVWVLIRMQVKFISAPERWQQVRLETWHRGLESIFFVRDYAMKDMDGNTLAVASSSWVIMDIDARRVLRSDRIGAIPKESRCTEQVFDELPGKIVVAEGALRTYAGSHTVSYSDVDYNHHANNARYIAWAMDAVPQEVSFKKPLKELSVNFIKEIRPGAKVDMMRSLSDDTFVVEGHVGSEIAFVVSLTF